MNLWRINIKTDAAEGVDPRRFCLDRNILGVGWPGWTRDWDGNYYLGRVAGAWQYRAAPEHTEADVVNVRCCHWRSVGTVDSVPGKVFNSFRAGRTLQAVHDETVLPYLKRLFNSNGEAVYDLSTLAHPYLPTVDLSHVPAVDYDFVPETTHFLQLETPESRFAIMNELLDRHGLLNS